MRSAIQVLFVMLTLSAPAVAQGVPGAHATEDALIIVSNDRAEEANRVTVAGLRFYQRLPEGMLAGATAEDLRLLDHHHLPYDVVDRTPWDGEYAIVGEFRYATLREAYTGADVRVLKSWKDHQLVKGSDGGFANLRERGYSVVPVTRDQTPAGVPAGRLLLPGSLTVDSSIAAIINVVSDTSIRNYVQGLQNFTSRYYANANRDTVARWVKARYIESGLTDAALDSFQFGGGWQTNVVASIPGGGEQEAEIIVGGHHDSYSSTLSQAPGADDNATGTAAALEMARVLKLVNYNPSLTLRFMGFAAEEAGLIGSNRYAAAARTAGRNIKAMLNYDMIGNRTQAQPDRDVYVVWYTGGEALRDLHGAMMQMYTTLTPVPTTSYRTGSDSYSFWSQSYPSVFCIERDFSPYYHSPNDLIQYLDMAYARDVVRSGLATLLTLDQAPPVVAGLRVRDRGDGVSLLAEWDSIAVPDFYRYRVYFGTASGVYTSNVQQTTRSKVYSGLTTGETYFIGVSIVDIVGREGMITERSMQPAIVPQGPTGLRLEDPGTGARLAWHPNQETDIVGYHVYQSFSLPMFLRLTADPQPDTVMALPAPNAWYYVTAVDAQGHESDSSNIVFASALDVDGPVVDVPAAFGLHQNYPNPFNGETTIGFSVPAGQSRVSICVYDLLGRKVATLVDGPAASGERSAVFQGTDFPSGVYIVVLRQGAQAMARKIMLMK
jgi:hypothetical protein